MESNRKWRMSWRSALFAAVAALTLLPAVQAQTNGLAPDKSSSARSESASTGADSSASVISAGGAENHYTWIEQFDGSSNAEGQVMLLDSSAGYVFGRHLLVDGGVPAYFVRATTPSLSGTATTNSFSALGDIYGQARLSFPTPAVNFKTQLTGRAPTGSTSDGISTGHATYDWTNRFDRGFGNWTPFFEVGLADSIPDAFAYRRPFASYGNLARFQLGGQYRVARWVGVVVSAFDVAPWGMQTIDSRVLGEVAMGPVHRTGTARLSCRARGLPEGRTWQQTTGSARAWTWRRRGPLMSRPATAAALITA